MRTESHINNSGQIQVEERNRRRKVVNGEKMTADSFPLYISA